MGREWRYGNPALSRLLFKHDGADRPVTAVIQVGKVIWRLKSQLLEHIAVAVMNRCDRFGGPVADQCPALRFFPVEARDFRPAGTHVSVNDPCALGIVQVGHSINVIEFVQLGRQFQQPDESTMVTLDVKVHHLEVGRTVVKHRCGPSLGQHDEARAWVSLAHGVQDRNCHRHIAQHRQADDEHIAELFFLNCHRAQD